VKPPIDHGTILVTGASAGLGVEFARQLAPRARRLILVARRRDRLEQLRAELVERHPKLEVRVEECDLADRDALTALCDRIDAEVGVVDVLVNNAGFGDAGMFDLASWDKLERMIELNVRALTYLTHRMLRPMIERRRGGILNVSSGAGLQFYPSFAAYIGTKHYVTGFTEALRTEVSSFGVVVSQLCPGPVSTEFNEVAGVPKKIDVGRVSLSAERCVRIALRGFSRGRALVVPGFLMALVMAFAGMTPRFMRRLSMRLAAPRLRAFQLETDRG
jgi:short-subunit dehydrogenase